jgi:2-oxoglutarate ferredoxin oxidoreductase subunit alpha
VKRDYEGAEAVLLSYGAVSRAAAMAVRRAREEGLPVGSLRLITVWPFPAEEVRQMAEKASKVVVLENNLGQLFPYIKAECAHRAEVAFLPPALLGQIHDPEAILEKIREILK